MGRTVPSYRIALEEEIQEWKRFSTPLRQADKPPFEELMTACRLYASSAGAACRPIPSDAIFMSILIYHQKLINELKSQIEHLKNQKRQDNTPMVATAAPVA